MQYRRLLARRVVRVQKLHVTVSLLLRLVIRIKMIVLVGAAVGTPVQVGGCSGYDSTVAAWARLTGKHIGGNCLAICGYRFWYSQLMLLLLREYLIVEGSI